MKLADYSQVVAIDQLDGALRAGGFEGVFHYLGDDFALREENPDIVAGIRALHWPQAGIFVPTLGAVNGAGDVARARAYGYPLGARLYLDIEPAEFDAAPGAWPGAADGWCEGIRAGGYSPGIYGVDRTVAACSDRADTIWRAKPGECDPAGAGLAAAFFAGARIVQCAAGSFAGVEMDVSFSQFAIAGGTFMAGPLDDAGTQQALIDDVLRTRSILTDGVQSVHDWAAGTVVPEPTWTIDLHARLTAIESAIQAGNGVVPAQLVQDVADLKAGVSRIEAALKGA